MAENEIGPGNSGRSRRADSRKGAQANVCGDDNNGLLCCQQQQRGQKNVMSQWAIQCGAEHLIIAFSCSRLDAAQHSVCFWRTARSQRSDIADP